MYFPGINEMAALAARDRIRMAEARQAVARHNAEEAYRRAEQPQAQEADVEDAQWREIPKEQLTGPR